MVTAWTAKAGYDRVVFVRGQLVLKLNWYGETAIFQTAPRQTLWIRESFPPPWERSARVSRQPESPARLRRIMRREQRRAAGTTTSGSEE